MRREITITDAVRNFADYINRVAYRGESYVLIRGGRPVAELSPVPAGTRLGDLPDLLRSLPRLSEGDADAFERDITRARDDLNRVPGTDPWDS